MNFLLNIAQKKKQLLAHKLLTIIVATILVLTVFKVYRQHFRDELIFETDYRQKTYSDIEEELFVPLGFKMRDQEVIPSLDYLEKTSCSEIFNSFLSGSKSQNESAAPPRNIPSELKRQFLLNGYTYLIEDYIDDRSGTIQANWNRSYLETFMSRDLSQIDNYDREGQAIYRAMLDYSVDRKKGMVVGSRFPWVEAIPLSLGAEHITTVEYMKILIEDFPKISYLHPVELAKEHVGQYDFIVSFSSIEHSGLGRYGDAVDPFGDLKEAQKIHCMLKEGGLFFVGLPIGWDILHWNLHRIYGRVRLALFSAGFDILDMYYKDQKESINVDWFARPDEDLLKLSKENFGQGSLWKQPIFVLRKR